MNKIDIASILLSSVVPLLLMGSTGASAGSMKMPPNAVPRTAEEIRKTYSGNTIDYKVSKYFLANDGSVLGIDKGGTWYAEGAWNVTGNVICLDTVWHGPPGKKTDSYKECYEKYKSGKEMLSKQTEGEKKYVGDISNDQEKKIRRGDLVSQQVQALKAKYQQ